MKKNKRRGNLQIRRDIKDFNQSQRVYFKTDSNKLGRKELSRTSIRHLWI